MWSDLFLFAGVLALAQFSPGPDMLLLTRTSLAEGLRAGWLTVLGIVTGLAIHATVAIFGMAVVLSQEGWLPIILKILAGLYLGWLGFELLRETLVATYGGTKEEKPPDTFDQLDCYIRGLLCNLLNPKVVVFFAGIVATFLGDDRPAWWPLVLWGTLVLEGVVLWGLWVAFLQLPKVRKIYAKASRAIDLTFGLGLLALGIVLLLEAKEAL